MTTQHTHHEHSDVDASVVEHASVPETTVDPSASEIITSVEEAGQAESADNTTPSSTVAAQISEATQDEIPALTIEEQSALPGQQKNQEPRSEQANPSGDTAEKIQPALTEPAAETFAAEKTEEEASFSYSKAISLTEVEEEIRPFTDFIEEFRQAEARLNASVQESEVEVFTLLPATEADFASSEQEVTSATRSTPASDIAPFMKQIIENIKEEARADEIASQVVADVPIAEENQVSKRNDATATTSTQSAVGHESSQSAPQSEVTGQKESTAPTEGPAAPVERAVSPLLRPASRLRLPRHGGARQHREEVIETPVQPPVEASQTSSSTESTITTDLPAATTEPSAEPEKPRPARRYRFDRPASTNGSTRSAPTTAATPSPSPQTRVEENRAAPSAGRTDTGRSEQHLAETSTKPAAQVNGTPATEQPTAKPSGTPDMVQTENTSSTPAEHSRKRGHDRVKEQFVAPVPAVSPILEAAVPAPETPSEEVAPEDLPPLEYADLQKASSRRRRRHRTGSPAANPTSPAAASVTPATPIAPVAPVTPPAAAARAATPTSPLATPAPSLYAITSGYTVSQMNQGNEGSGPFMGPEPSPARGSVLHRDGRTTRAESQRTPTFPTPSRPHEGSSASLNHFANVISQAIQTQTDRMVAEMRRAGQSPTNVSVSLPPFPSTERVGVFVDVANLLYSARTLRITVDFGKLLDFLRGNRRLVRAHAYCPTSPQAGEEQMFLQAVKGLGYRITTKNYKTFSSGAKKADLDLDLCMDVVRLVDGNAVDCIVLVSGDSDFMPMLDYCSDHGVRVEVAAFDEAMSATLRQSCDLFVNLSMLEEIRS